MKKENAEKLQKRIAMEAVALLSLCGTTADTRMHEESIPLIGKAWGLPADATLGQIDLILREKAVVRSMEAGEKAEHVVKEEEILHNATGLEILTLTRGLFESALHLDRPEDRQTMFDLAGELEQTLNLDDWIVKAEGEEYTPVAERGQSGGAAENQPALC